MSDVTINDRVKLSSNLIGTLKFVGEIHVADGVFYGIELDTPNGKSNGTLDDKFYFICKEKHGLFVKRHLFIKIEEETESNLCVPDIKIVDIEKQEIQIAVEDIIPSSLEYNNAITVNKVNIYKADVQNVIKLSDDNLKSQLNKGTYKVGIPTIATSNIPALSHRPRSIMPRASEVPTSRILNPLKTNIQITQHDLENNGTENRAITNENTDSQSFQNNIAPAVSILSTDHQPKILPKLSTIPETKEFCKKCVVMKKDCEEKLLTFKMLRKKDQEKMIALKKVNCDLMSKLSEANDLVEKSKKERESISREYKDYRESMESIEETMESLAVDKEVAEEELELHRDQVKELKIQVEKLVQENKDLTQSINGKGLTIEDSVIISKYRTAIADLGIIIDNLKLEINTKDKDLELLLEKQMVLEIENDTMKNDNIKLEENIQEMKEIVDGIGDTEFIVDNLTEKNMHLETKMSILEKRVLELDEMNDKSKQDHETNYTEIKTLRLENDVLHHTVGNLKREISSTADKQNEIIDLNGQFRNKIKQLESDILQLNIKLKQKDVAPTAFLRVPMNPIATKAPITIDSKLRDLELSEKSQLSNILRRFLIDTFDKSQGYMDTIDIIFLLDRYSNKISIILNHIDKTKMSSNTDTEVKTFHTNLEFLLLYWQSLLTQLKRNVYQSDLNNLNKLGSYYSAMAMHEPIIDMIVGWIRTDSFDESRQLKELAESVEYFRCFCNNHFESQSWDYESKIKYFVKMVNVGSLSLDSNILLIQTIISSKFDTNLRFKDLINYMKKFINELQAKVKKMFTHMTNLPEIELSSDYVTKIDQTNHHLNLLVQSLSHLSVDLAMDMIPIEILSSRLYDNLHLNTSNAESGKAFAVFVTSIKNTVDDVSNALDNGLFEITRKIKPLHTKISENVIDKSVQKHRETLMYFKKLVTEVEVKDCKIKELNVALATNTELLHESTLSINHVQSKLKKTIRENREESLAISSELTKLTKELHSKDICIKFLNDQISDLNLQMCTISNVPVSIEQEERYDGSNKEGYITEIRILKSALKVLTTRNRHVASNDIKAALGELRPLSISTVTHSNVDGSIAKSQSMSWDIYERLSKISVVSLTDNGTKLYRNRLFDVETLKVKCRNLKRECSEYKIDMVL